MKNERKPVEIAPELISARAFIRTALSRTFMYLMRLLSLTLSPYSKRQVQWYFTARQVGCTRAGVAETDLLKSTHTGTIAIDTLDRKVIPYRTHASILLSIFGSL